VNKVHFILTFLSKKGFFSYKPVRITAYVFGALLSFFLLLIFLLMARLSFSPINLDTLTPEINANLNFAQAGIQGQVSHTQLVWKDWLRPFEIELVELTLQKGDRPEWLKIDNVGISLNLLDLLGGHFSLKQVRFYHPYIELEREENGQFSLGLGEGPAEREFLLQDILPLLAMGEANSNLGKLNELSQISVINAHVRLTDAQQKKAWDLPKTTFTLKRQNKGFSISLKLKPQRNGGSLTFSLNHRLGSSRLDASLNFKHISFNKLFESKDLPLCPSKSELTALDGLLNFLQCWDLPLDGKVSLAFNPETFEIIEGECDVNLGKGFLDLSLAKLNPLPLQKGTLIFSLTPKKFTLKEISLISDSMKTHLIGDIKSQSPFILTNFFGSMESLTLQGQMEDLLLDHFDAIWPQKFAINAREWLTKHLHKGILTQVGFSLKGHSEKEEFTLDEFKGSLEGERAEINYLEGLPPAQNVSVQGTFDQKGFDINIFSGTVDVFEVKKGRVQISGLDTGKEALSLDLETHGPLSSLLSIIDHKPLEYASYGGLDPNKAKGEGSVHLKMNFPLINDLRFKDVKMTGIGTFDHVSLERKITDTLSAQLNKGNLSLDMTQDQLEITGKGLINKLPSTLLYSHDFKGQNPNEIQIKISAVPSFDDFKQFGFDLSDYAHGPVPTTVTYLRTKEGENAILLDLDTTPSTLSFNLLDWQKNPGETSSLSLSLGIENEALTRLDDVKFTTPAYSFAGQVFFNENKGWNKIHLSEFKGPFTQTRITIETPSKDAYKIDFKGQSLNLEKILELLKDDTKKQDHPPTTLKLSADVETLRLGQDKIFNNVNGAADLFIQEDDTYWKEVHFTAQAGQGTANKGHMAQVSGGISFDLLPPQNGIQTLEVRANDAGVFLKNLDVYQNIRGGYITIKAQRKNQGPFTGVFKMKEFDALEVPLLAQFAGLLSPMGISNLLSGDQAISLERFECQFEFGDEFVNIHKGVGKSIALGFTVDGKLDRKNRLFSLKGNVIPARFLNSILSNIPIIGSLLNGGDGQGMFAISYTVKGSFDSPDVSLNPLSALAPGFIRNLFQFSDDAE